MTAAARNARLDTLGRVPSIVSTPIPTAHQQESQRVEVQGEDGPGQSSGDESLHALRILDPASLD